MMRELVLFCGGPAMGHEAVPKPLLHVDASRSLIETFLAQVSPEMHPRVTLLVERTYADRFRLVLESAAWPFATRVVECDDGSSTLVKFRTFLEAQATSTKLIEFSYPDLFFNGDLSFPQLEQEDLDRTVCISQIPVSSRFPRLMVDEYTGEVRGLSRHTSGVPANPYFIYGGHLLGHVDTLRRYGDEFVADHDPATVNLEFDFFSWLINRSRIKALPLYGELIHADSPRDFARLRASN